MMAWAESSSLSDVGRMMTAQSAVTIYTAREIVTLLGAQPFEVDRTFDDKVIVPGFNAQHDHPVLAALTMSSEILSIEDWALPFGTIPAVSDKQDFLTRLTMADSNLEDPDEALLSWGYHECCSGR